MKPRELTPVRVLARRYAGGELSQRDYIHQRRALLDDIAAGRIPLPDEDIPPSPPPRRALNEALATDDTVEFSLPGGLGKGRTLTLAITGVVLLGAAAGAWLWWSAGA
ncbi:MAG: hypothetical protein RL434_1367 [Pseudomonadota bacterium]|jgi:hypothetical protein